MARGASQGRDWGIVHRRAWASENASDFVFGLPVRMQKGGSVARFARLAGLEDAGIGAQTSPRATAIVRRPATRVAPGRREMPNGSKRPKSRLCTARKQWGGGGACNLGLEAVTVTVVGRRKARKHGVNACHFLLLSSLMRYHLLWVTLGRSRPCLWWLNIALRMHLGLRDCQRLPHLLGAVASPECLENQGL